MSTAGSKRSTRTRTLGAVVCVGVSLIAAGCGSAHETSRARPATTRTGSTVIAAATTTTTPAVGPDRVAIALLSQDPAWHATVSAVERRHGDRVEHSAGVTWSLDQASADAVVAGGGRSSNLAIRDGTEGGRLCRTPSLAPTPTGQTVRILVAPTITVPASELPAVQAQHLAEAGDRPATTVTSGTATLTNHGLSVHITGRAHIESHWLARRYHIPLLGRLPSFTEDVLFAATVPLRLAPATTSDLAHAILVTADEPGTTVSVRLDHFPKLASDRAAPLLRRQFQQALSAAVRLQTQAKIDDKVAGTEDVRWFGALGYSLSMLRVGTDPHGLTLAPSFCRADSQLSAVAPATAAALTGWPVTLDLLDRSARQLTPPLTVSRSWATGTKQVRAGTARTIGRGAVPPRSTVVFPPAVAPAGASVAVRVRERDHALACRTLPIAPAPGGEVVHLLLAPRTTLSPTELDALVAPLAGTVQSGAVGPAKATVRLSSARLVPSSGRLRLSLGGTLRVAIGRTVYRFDFTYAVGLRLVPDQGLDPSGVLDVRTTDPGRLHLRWHGTPPAGGENIRKLVQAEALPSVTAQVTQEASTMVDAAVDIPAVTWWTDQGFALTMRTVASGADGVGLDGTLCRQG